jgi:CO/xanthine dehydrogenase FAD-binding subunit
VELRSLSGQRVLDLQDFLTGYRATALRPGELMTALLIPSPPVTARGSFVKFGQRSHLVISIVMVAALLDVLDDHVASARLVVGACSPVATRVPLLERALVDQPLTVTSIRNVVRSVALPELSPIDDVRATSAYRLRVVRELIVDAIVACWNPS